MDRPVICITGRWTPHTTRRFMGYYEACVQPNSDMIRSCNGVPFIAAAVTDEEAAEVIVSRCDGLFVSGGGDIDPAYFGEQRHPLCGESIPQVDTSDLLLIRSALKQHKPILGICRGMQVINVAFGGTLYQDVFTQTGTTIPHRDISEKCVGNGHPVSVVADSPLGKLVKQDRITVTSAHHQAVKTLGDKLIAMAFADDGIIEAYYLDSTRQWLRGYQWHPEFWPEEKSSRLTFNEFIEACRSGMTSQQGKGVI